MKTLSSTQVISQIETKKKTVLESEYRRLKQESDHAIKRQEHCIDALILELKNVKEALRYQQFEGRQQTARIERQKGAIDKIAASSAVLESFDAGTIAADIAFNNLRIALDLPFKEPAKKSGTFTIKPKAIK